MNKNVETCYNQIMNTLERLYELGYIKYYDKPKITESKKRVLITWNNHTSSKELNEHYFLSPKQYIKIISTRAYHALLKDNSIIRFSFEFEKSKLMKESLLWWPCPANINEEDAVELSLDDAIIMAIISEEKEDNVIMRSPVRIDFDANNDTPKHPKSHIHFQNADTRINSNYPICFNRFIDFIIKNFYPDWDVNFDKRNFISFSIDDSNHVNYCNSTNIIY